MTGDEFLLISFFFSLRVKGPNRAPPADLRKLPTRLRQRLHQPRRSFSEDGPGGTAQGSLMPTRNRSKARWLERKRYPALVCVFVGSTTHGSCPIQKTRGADRRGRISVPNVSDCYDCTL